MKSFCFSVALLFCTINFGLAQKKFTNPERADLLRVSHEDAKIVAISSKTRYEFGVSDAQLKIKQSDNIDLISLKSNLKYRRFVYYNDHVQLTSSTVRYTSRKGFLSSREACGNYEVGDVFYSDAKVCSYSFDVLYEASEITFKSEKVYKDPKYLTKVFFHDQDPTEKREISFVIPEGVNIDLVEQNFDRFEIKKEVSLVDGKQVHTYTINKIEEFKSESNSLGVLHHYPHIIVVTRDYDTSAGKKTVLSSVDDLYAWYSGLVNQVDVDAESLSTEVAELIASATSDEEKIRKIYYWVQENIKYVAFEDGIAGFMPEAPQNVYKNRFGDCKGMAMLTKTMLDQAGYDARLTWIGTNKIPYNYDLPSLAVDNHMICTLSQNGKLYILDATEKYIALGAHGERIQGKEMLIEDGDNFIRKVVPVEKAEENLISRTENLQIKDQSLIGDGEVVMNGEAKKMILYYSTNSKVDDKDDLFDFLSVSQYNNDDEVKVNNIPETERDLPLSVKYNYALKNRVSSFDKDLFIEIDWDKTYGDLKIEEDRVSDYYFGRKVMNRITKTVEIPSNYSITHLPESLKEIHKDISIKISFEQNGNSIIYSNEIVVGSGKILKEDFEAWNKLVLKMNEVYNDQIVLTKKS